MALRAFLKQSETIVGAVRDCRRLMASLRAAERRAVRATAGRFYRMDPGGSSADMKSSASVKPIHPLLAGRSCYHRWEIAPGLYTPGTHVDFEPSERFEELGIPQDISGLRALDVGAWDGAYTFELAKRGAEATALDPQDPDVTIFNAARRILNVQVNYIRGNVYDLTEKTHGKYNIVLFTGVYYHLKNPVLALQRIREILEDDGRLYIEGATCSHHLARQLASSVPGASFKSLVRLVDGMPISLFDWGHEIYDHPSNWFFPTTACLRGMLSDCGFIDIELMPRSDQPANRILGHARANPAKPRPGSPYYEAGRLEPVVQVHDFVSPRLALLEAESSRTSNTKH
jgi:2-polyprenyl-3-methyl-5-hydroxy-6-metoxy-1,4-benzoquinol methylase